MSALKHFSHIPVKLPELAIYKRMGYNRHLTQIPQNQKAALTDNINDAFALCQPQGRYLIESITSNNGEVTRGESDTYFESASLCNLLQGCDQIVYMAATVGGDVVEATIECVRAENGSGALIYDAVASETTDSILDWLCQYLRSTLIKSGRKLTDMRFSAGYGDLALSNQGKLHDLLKLEEMGITLSESYIMTPEKTVTAIAGISG